MDEFTRFNLYEGSFWILLGIVSYILHKILPEKYKKTTIVAGTIFILFGISDNMEIKTSGFLYPIIWWLLAWKVACVVGIIFIVVWYFKLRLN